jgi:hypothetical protein
MFILNGTPLPLDTPFVAGDIQYPANWLRLTSLEEKQAIGIEEVPDPEQYDDRFFWGPGNPKDFEQVKTMLLQQIKQIAFSLLSPTDYKLIRKLETGKEVDDATLAERAAIRQAVLDNEALVNKAKTTEQLASVQFTWPTKE